MENFSRYCDLKAYMQLLVFFRFQFRCNCGISNLKKKTLKNDVLNLRKVKNGRNSIFLKIGLITFFLGTTDTHLKVLIEEIFQISNMVLTENVLNK